MKKGELIKSDGKLYRIISAERKLLVFEVGTKKMPIVMANGEYEIASEDEIPLLNMVAVTPKGRKTMNERYSVISPVLGKLATKNERNEAIRETAAKYGLSRKTVLNYLFAYLTYMDDTALLPKQKRDAIKLTADQKIMRRALNKYFYNQNKNSLMVSYTMMLKEYYCDGNGKLLDDRPTFNQYRYFYEKRNTKQKYYISREGKSTYERNRRPLLGDGVQQYAPNLGTAMLDGTVCDIYLVDDAGKLVGRPLLVVAVDANTSLCLGYSLSWEGGTYSLVRLMQSIISDKVELCAKLGIKIKKKDWNVSSLPGVMMTDRGTEYMGKNFEQITDLGVRLVSLPPYRADLKAPVEKFFGLVQGMFKPSLKGKGVIMPDWQERGSHDYRLDACLTLAEFERIVVKCIVYYNSERLIEKYPFTPKMLKAGLKPCASAIWNYKLREAGTNLIEVTKERLASVLLPRTIGKFNRTGLIVNKLRYRNDAYKGKYLTGGTAVVAYNPDNTGTVWLREDDGTFVPFELIEARFADMSIYAASEIMQKQKIVRKSYAETNLQAKIDMLDFIEITAEKSRKTVITKDIRATRSTERKRNHKDLGDVDGLTR